MARHTPQPRKVSRTIDESKLMHIHLGFVFRITVRSDGSWIAMLGDREIAVGRPYEGDDKALRMMTNGLMIEAEKAAHAAIERAFPG